MYKITTLIGALLLFITGINAQNTSDTKRNEFSLLFGVSQPIVLKGFNFEVNYWTEKWVFDYSHGIGLNIDAKLLGEEYENQKINFNITHSLGFGVGYRFTEGLNLRFEPKMHTYNTYYEGVEQVKDNSIVNFTTYTLGFGLYYRYQPFKKKTNALKGVTIAPSVRYWYKVSSTLSGDTYTYENTKTNTTETFEAPNIGMSNTPLFVNISVGYTF